MLWFSQSVYSAEISRTRAAVFRSVAIQQFAPVTAAGYTDAITESRNRREVANDKNRIFRGFTFAGAGKSCW